VPEPERICKNCMFYGDGWQGSPQGLCLGEGEYHEPDDRCDFFEPRRIRMKICGDFKGMVTNPDVCVHWTVVAAVPGPDGSTAIFPCPAHCKLDLKCPTLGQKPWRPYDPEEDSFE